jgi:hypothetical protein
MCQRVVLQSRLRAGFLASLSVAQTRNSPEGGSPARMPALRSLCQQLDRAIGGSWLSQDPFIQGTHSLNMPLDRELLGEALSIFR